VTSQPSDKLPLRINDLEYRSTMLVDVERKSHFSKDILPHCSYHCLPNELIAPSLRSGVTKDRHGVDLILIASLELSENPAAV
jgi:hypothetical protein